MKNLFALLVSLIRNLSGDARLSLRVKATTFTTGKRGNAVVDETSALNLRDIKASLDNLTAFVSKNEKSTFEISYPEKHRDTVESQALAIVEMIAQARSTPSLQLSAQPYEYSGKNGKFVGFRVGVTPITDADIEKQMSSL